MNARLRTAIVAACASIVCLASAAAQQPPLQQAVRFIVKPDRVAEFRQLQAENTAAAKERGLLYRGVWQNANNLNEFVILTPVDAFADLYEGPGNPTAEGAARQARMAQTYTSREVTVSRVLHELGVPAKATPRLVHTSTTTLHAGKAAEYIALQAEFAAAAKKAGVTGFGTSRVVFGGPATRFMNWRAIESMAEFDSPNPVTAAMGAETFRSWVERINPLVKDPQERTIYRYQESLSYYPQQ